MLNLPLQLLRREWRQRELQLLFIAVFLAVACITTIQGFGAMIRSTLGAQAVEFLGADVLVTSSVPIDEKWINQVRHLEVQQTHGLSFLSMISHQHDLQLAQIKAVDAQYPLRGKLMITKTMNNAQGMVTRPPKPGEVYLGARLFPLLHVTIGDTITIGKTTLKIAGQLVEDPGQRGDWLSISPPLVMNLIDVGQTQIIQPGSNVTYLWYLAGPSPMLDRLHGILRPLFDDRQKWIAARQGINVLDNTIQKTLDYLTVGSVMSLVLAAVAISLATLRYSERHALQVALLRSFGASDLKVVFLHLSLISWIGLLASALGVCFAYALQPLLFHWLKGLVPIARYAFYWTPGFVGLATGLLVLWSFSISNIWQLRRVSAVTIFNRPLMGITHPWSTYVGSMLLLFVLVFLTTQSFTVSLMILAGILLFIVLILCCLWFLSIAHGWSKRWFLPWRLGISNILRHRENSILQMVGLGMALTAVLSLSLFKYNVLVSWQQQLPVDSANYFLINIAPEQAQSFDSALKSHHIAATIYPMVRGRLVAINQSNVQQRFKNTIQSPALQRELNLSWSENLPQGNRIIQGAWMRSGTMFTNQVSVEQGLAKQLQLKLGDTLSFLVGNQRVEAVITSFREVDWETFKPNFFMLFTPGLLNALPHTLITSIYLPAAKANILNALSEQFPNLTIIDVASIVLKMQNIIDDISKAINLLSLFAWAIGIVIVALAIISFHQTKREETQVLKLLGMRRSALLLTRSSEACLIGLITGTLACAIAWLLNVFLAHRLFSLSFQIPWLTFAWVIMLTTCGNVLLSLMLQARSYETRKEDFQ